MAIQMINIYHNSFQSLQLTLPKTYSHTSDMQHPSSPHLVLLIHYIETQPGIVPQTLLNKNLVETEERNYEDSPTCGVSLMRMFCNVIIMKR